MTYRMAPFPITSYDLQDHSLQACSRASFFRIVVAVDKISTDITRRSAHLRQLSFLLFFALWFLSSSFFRFYSSPNLSGRRFDVYRTSTHAVALLRIQDAGLKCAARGWQEMQDPKKSQKIRHLGTTAQLSRALQLRHTSTIGKNLLNSTVSPTCFHNTVNFGPLPAEIGSLAHSILRL